MSYLWCQKIGKKVVFIFRALRYRNYRLFFIGQSVSLAGTWMQRVAIAWLVYRLTGSPLLLGVVDFTGQIPAFFVTPFGGILGDRYNRHRLLIITQTLAMVQALILSALVLSENIAIWHIIILSIFLGLINAFDIPIRQTFTVDLVKRQKDLGNAIALNSSMFNIARMIGPSIAGVLIATAGEGICFLLNGLSYLAVIASLFLMRITPRKKKFVKAHILKELKEGFIYAFGFKPIRVILTLLALVSLMGVPYQVLMPVFARDIFHGGPRTLGSLVVMAGMGALIGAVYLALRKNILGLGRVIVLTTAVFGLGIIILSFSKILWFSMLVILVCGFGMMVQMGSCNTILQTIVEEDKRGRVMGFYTLAFMGTIPFGSLLAGSLASRMGAPFTLLIGGICCMAGAFYFAQRLPSLQAEIRPIYAQKGVIPEVAKGIQLSSRF